MPETADKKSFKEENYAVKIFFLVKSLIDAADKALIDKACTHGVVKKEFLKHIWKFANYSFFIDFSRSFLGLNIPTKLVINPI